MDKNKLTEVIKKKGLSAPQLSYMWRVALPQINNIVGSNVAVGDGYDMGVNIGKTINQEDVNFRVHSISTPMGSVDSDKMINGNSFWYYAKHNDIGNISMDVYEFEDGNTLKYFEAWQKTMMNSDGTYNPPVAYKRDITLYHLSSTREDLTKHIYKGYFVTGISDVSYDYEANDITKYNIQLTGDSVEHITYDISGLSGKPEEQSIIQQIFDRTISFPTLENIIAEVLK